MRVLKGWFGELLAAFGLWLSLDPRVYHRHHDVIVPSSNGTTQIDHVIISPFGVFIVETKNMKGWIFGSEEQARWTQKLYSASYSFQNPLRQTFRQRKVLATYLDLDEARIHDVVYFVGDCELKSRFPPKVRRSGLGRYIKSFGAQLLSPDEIQHLQDRLLALASDGSLTRKSHLASLRRRHGSTTTCPKCGARLVKKTAKKGPSAGSVFLGCETWPKCRFTRNVG